ncbi:hypothetical protein [Chryseosolibacter indicus]|uniref:Response regulatory domain-containing protein n=1 Tax=Chryseosolibacter indicus TaxID=2782351 RepID=A0ABS5VLP7_9BACT|nr:hypothetical protein [Chryseosolibacter indicus]MBT1701692.1 hypothetical protein [Chryseosolibacter indicus]
MSTTVIGIFADDKVEKYIFEKAMEKYEHKIEFYVFSTPEEGLMRAKEIHFDVVFIEIHYWGETFGGFSILTELKKVLNKPTIAVGMTSLMQEGDLEKMINAGFHLCIEKPLAFESIGAFASK